MDSSTPHGYKLLLLCGVEESEGGNMNSTEICNIALGSIGQGRIDSMSEESEAARNCKLYYDLTRKNLLSMYPWEFAHRNTKLALLDKETPGWRFTYAYPAGALVIRKVYDMPFAHQKDDGNPVYTVIAINESQKAICANIENAYCDYTFDVENAGIFPATFVQALAYSLAAALSYPLSRSMDMQQVNYQLAQNAIQQAKYTSAIQDEHKPSYPHRYIDAGL